jgi:DNA (cytosine-5)-methyltransferase 1
MNYISLFSGGMGLDIGLESVGFNPILCIENNPQAVKTIRHNRKDLMVFDRSISDVTGKEIRDVIKNKTSEGKIDLVAGGPPCQAFSVFGNRLGIKDARGQLIFEFIRVIEEVQPTTFLLENVRGLLSMSVIPKPKKGEPTDDINYYKPGSLLRLVIQQFEEIGYHVDCFIVNSVNYGAPQIRERLLLIGNKKGIKCHFPHPTHSNRKEDNLPSFITLGDVIGPGSGFVDPCPEVMDFSPRKLKYLSMVPAGGNWRSLPIDIQKESMGKSWYLKGGRSAYWRKLSFAFPSPTVVTMPNHAGTSMCHPTELRAISVGEAAAIQEFPRDWIFLGSAAEKFKQIGNAVPVRLGQVAGEAIKDLIARIRSGEAPKLLSQSGEVIHLRPHVRTRTFWKNGKVFAGDFSYYDDEKIQIEPQVLQLAITFPDRALTND